MEVNTVEELVKKHLQEKVEEKYQEWLKKKCWKT